MSETEPIEIARALSARRILISGGPRTGKTTLAQTLAGSMADGARLRGTDDLIGKLEWSNASQEVAKWLCEPGPWIIEGVAAERALRKWLAENGTTLPFDLWIVLLEPRAAQTPKQAAMAKACDTVRKGVLVEVQARLRRLSPAPRVLLGVESQAAQRRIEEVLVSEPQDYESLVRTSTGLNEDKPQRANPVPKVSPPRVIRLRTSGASGDDQRGDPLDRVRGVW